MNKHEVLHIIDTLKEVAKERKQIRRKLCRFIRENVNKGKLIDDWLKRKSDKNYLGDLSDSQLEYYSKLIYKNLEDKQIENNKSIF